jgi:hypothetical protein
MSELTEAFPVRVSSVSHDDSAGLGRLCLDEIEREPLVDAAEERLPLAQDDRVNNQPARRISSRSVP